MIARFMAKIAGEGKSIGWRGARETEEVLRSSHAEAHSSFLVWLCECNFVAKGDQNWLILF